MSDIPLTLDGVLGALYAAVAVMLMVVLYHVLFIVVDARKILRRFEELSKQTEEMLLKPLAILDKSFQWVIDTMQRKKKKKDKHHEFTEKSV